MTWYPFPAIRNRVPGGPDGRAVHRGEKDRVVDFNIGRDAGQVIGQRVAAVIVVAGQRGIEFGVERGLAVGFCFIRRRLGDHRGGGVVIVRLLRVGGRPRKNGRRDRKRSHRWQAEA